MKGVLAKIILVLIILGLGVQLSLNVAYHCGRCGLQKWYTKILWMDFSQDPEDEYGTALRWECAHENPCEHIWLEGPLGKYENEYWPLFHLSIAKGESLPELLKIADEMKVADLKRVDKLGRSALHWLAVHPDIENKHLLEQLLLARGTDPDLRDSQGLLAKDWSERKK